MIQTEQKQRFTNRTKISSGTCRLGYANPLAFKEWKVYLNKETGMVLVEFIIPSHSGRYSTPWTVNPLSFALRDEITFDNENDWEIFEKQCDIAFKYQIRKFPENYKQQIIDSLNDLNLSKGRIKLTDKSETQIAFIKSLINNN
jgi:hypothetical protein